MPRFYVRDRDIGGAIVNAIETDTRANAEDALTNFVGDVYLDEHPPLDVLERYRYWRERP